MRNLSIILSLCISATAVGLMAMPAAADAGSAVASLMKNARDMEVRDYDKLEKEPPTQLLAELSKYLHDPEDKVRMEAISATSWVASRNTNRGIRQQAMRMLFAIAAGPEDHGFARYAAGILRGFSEEEFTDDMRQLLYDHITSHSDSYQINSDAVLLAGIANIKSLTPWLRQLSAKGDWLATLSLGRMGDQAAIQQIAAKVKKQKDQSQTDTVERHKALNDLAFTRQPQAVQVLVNVLFSDDKSVGNGTDVPSVKYAQRAVGLLARILENFPIKAEGRGKDGSEEEVEIARRWITEQGIDNLKIKR